MVGWRCNWPSLSLVDGAVDGQASISTEAAKYGSSKPDGSGTEADHE